MAIEHTEYKVGGGAVRVYDGAVPLKLRQDLYTWAMQASYKIGWEDSLLAEHRQHMYLHARFNDEELAKTGLLMQLAPTPVFKEVAGLALKSAVLNLSTPSDVHFAHAHPEQRVLLYYVNFDWRPQWYGETVFFKENLDDIELALQYTPGRIVAFDGHIPHSIRPQSHVAPHFRFTLSMFFDTIPAPKAPAEGTASAVKRS
jgi:hypothetical protein